MTTQQTDYEPLWSAVAKELESRAENGSPLRVNLWDGNHFARAPREIIGHPKLSDAVKRVGKPAYAIELSGNAESFNEIFSNYANGSSEMRQAIEEFVEEQVPDKAAKIMLKSLLERSREGAEVVFPDPRKRPSFNASEVPMYFRFKQEMRQTEGKCTELMADAFRASLSPAEEVAYLSMQEKFADSVDNAVGMDGKKKPVNEAIADVIDQRFPDQAKRGHTVPVTLYGAGHFAGLADLNERNPGLDIAIFDDASSAAIFYTVDSAKARQFPDYVWYANDRVLVKIDTDAEKMKLIGETEVQALREWERAGFPESKKPKLAPEELAQCKAAIAHLQPYDTTQDWASEMQALPLPNASGSVGAQR